jgi:MipA family protein
MLKFGSAVLATAFAAAAFPAAVSAQMPTLSMPDGVRVTVGAAVVTMPRYEGAATYMAGVVPILKFSAIGGSMAAMKRFDARALDDISFSLIRHNGLDVGVLIGYRLGRKENDSLYLHGTGDINGGLVGGGFARYEFGRAFVRASVHQSLTGDDTGAVLRVATGTKYALTERVLIKADLWADAANDTYMDTFFGVTRSQSRRSGLPIYDPGAGFKSISAKLGTEVALTPDWTLDASAGYSRLIGDAADSPLVSSADRYDGRLGLSRSFDWRFR